MAYDNNGGDRMYQPKCEGPSEASSGGSGGLATQEESHTKAEDPTFIIFVHGYL
jgi:hypothetical protein